MGIASLPLIPDLVQVGVTDAAEQDFNLYVVFGWIAPRDRGGGQRRRRTGSGISFCVVHALTFHSPGPDFFARSTAFTPRLESNALEAVARSFRFIAYSSCHAINHWRIRCRTAILIPEEKKS